LTLSGDAAEIIAKRLDQKLRDQISTVPNLFTESSMENSQNINTRSIWPGFDPCLASLRFFYDYLTKLTRTNILSLPDKRFPTSL
jgi:hypothetical protein